MKNGLLLSVITTATILAGCGKGAQLPTAEPWRAQASAASKKQAGEVKIDLQVFGRPPGENTAKFILTAEGDDAKASYTFRYTYPQDERVAEPNAVEKLELLLNGEVVAFSDAKGVKKALELFKNAPKEVRAQKEPVSAAIGALKDLR